MSDWWESAYPGGPMVGPAWPRALYPPDAKPGHTPSADGPDVQACKRAIWRGGRWERPEAGFDDSYSNSFSHGKTGGNVGESGVAGFQRQMKIQPTGWVGKETANAIRSARIPDGLPHEGEPLLDATAIDQIEQAIKMYAEASSPDAKVRDKALAKAKNQIGVKESPYGSNDVKYTDWYGMIGPWCAMFCTWCFELSAQDLGKDSPSFVRGSYYAYVPYILSDAKAGRRGLSITGDPKPGDLALYDWERDGEFDHIGIFEKWVGGRTFNAIEGNTSTSSNSNGGEVMRRQRDAGGSARIEFVRVKEPA